MGQLLEALKGIKLPKVTNNLVVEADRIYGEWPKTASYIEHLETKIKNLEAELEKLRAKSGDFTAGTDLVFDAVTGTYTGKDGLRYCQPCFVKDHLRVPLKNNDYGWTCMVCKKHFSDPSRQPPPELLQGEWECSHRATCLLQKRENPWRL